MEILQNVLCVCGGGGAFSSLPFGKRDLAARNCDLYDHSSEHPRTCSLSAGKVSVSDSASVNTYCVLMFICLFVCLFIYT